jgi:succinylglutamate desuccinylase
MIVGKPQGKITVGKRYVGANITRCFKERGWDVLEWVHVVPDRNK